MIRASTDEQQSTLIIGEIGQNHNGNMGFAMSMIDIAALPVIDHFTQEQLQGVNAIKLTKRDLEEELTAEAERQPYNGPHSFGPTYGEHRRAIELSYEEHRDLGQYAHERGLLFIETLCSPKCVRLCEMVNIDYLKVASRDLTNIPLLTELAATRVPIILSTGMGDFDALDRALDEITQYHEQITILHCISEYPARYENIGLPRIAELKRRYPQYRIGYSDHSIGIMIPVAAVSMGATVIEKHITLSRRLKGADHAGSVEPDGLWRMTRDIRNLERAMQAVPEDRRRAATASTRLKLERSLATRRPIGKGERLTEQDLVMLSPGGGMTWDQRELVVGRPARDEIPQRAQLQPEMFDLSA